MTTQTVQPHPSRASFTRIAIGLTLILILLVITGVSNAPLFPNKVTAASAPSTDFSAERALVYIPVIARSPHPAGSPAQAEVRAYLIQKLKALGLAPEVQPSGEIANIIVRLPGSHSSGAIVVLAHYDSNPMSPGALDNGSGVAALLEIVRALSAAPPLQNDVIALFDDAEEGPPPFQGTWLFAKEHPWRADVKVAIGMDIAARGFITINDTGPRNGFLMPAFARTHRGYYWSSATGSGTYDTWPLRQMGKQVIELEDNYCFRQQHTAFDTVELIKPASLQQLGDQALSLTRELGNLDIGSPWGANEVFFSLPVLGFVHYPDAWSLPLSIVAALLLVACIVLALRRKIASGRGLIVGFFTFLVTAVVNYLIINAVWKQIPHWLSWKTSAWPEWPEVIPTDGGLIEAAAILFTLDLCIVAFRLSRARSRLADLSLVGILYFVILSVIITMALPRNAYMPVWPALIGGLAWLVSLVMKRKSRWTVTLPAFIAAGTDLLFFASLPVLMFFSTGLYDVAAMAAIMSLVILAVLPAIEAAVMQMREVKS